MYICKTSGGYNRDGSAFVRRGDFLILWSPDCGAKTMFGFIRKVALKQLGPWMMGKARVEGKSVTVSGAYGNDGLCDGPNDYPCPKDAVQLPEELRQRWLAGGGWNGAGSEAEAMREWALKTFHEVRNGKP